MTGTPEPVRGPGAPEDGRDARSLSRAHASITLPLVVLVFAVVSLSAPVALFSLRRASLRAAARDVARDVAALVGREAEDRPALWRYDAPKLLEHARAYEGQPDVAMIAVVDNVGDRVDRGPDVPGSDVVWMTEPILANGEAIGAAWVAAPIGEARGDALLLLAPFAALGLALAVLLYWLPLRALGRAESRLSESRRALAGLAASLEEQVAERSSELLEANAALRAKEQRLREVSARALALQEGERRAIARDLHDTAGQSLTVMRIQLELLRARSEPPEHVREVAGRAIEATDGAIEEFRRALARLAPAVLDEVGLVAAVERACDDLAERLSVDVRRTLPAARPALGGAVETAFYRIAQEALTNVARHAGATVVEVTLEVSARQVVLEVRDDGRGFDPEAPRDEASRGLPGMRERVELLGGELEITSRPGGGTVVRATLPLPEDGAAVP